MHILLCIWQYHEHYYHSTELNLLSQVCEYNYITYVHIIHVQWREKFS